MHESVQCCIRPLCAAACCCYASSPCSAECMLLESTLLPSQGEHLLYLEVFLLQLMGSCLALLPVQRHGQASTAAAAAGGRCWSAAMLQQLRPAWTTYRNLSFVCAAWFFADTCLLATNNRVPPCSSPPRAGAQVGLCAVVMLRAEAHATFERHWHAACELCLELG